MRAQVMHGAMLVLGAMIVVWLVTAVLFGSWPGFLTRASSVVEQILAVSRPRQAAGDLGQASADRG